MSIHDFFPVVIVVIFLSVIGWGLYEANEKDTETLVKRTEENAEYGIDSAVRTNCLSGWLTASGHDLYIRDENFNPIRCKTK